MTDDELVELVETRAPEELTPAEMDELRQRLPYSPRLQQALHDRLEMERYLAETGPNAAHRSEVEGTVEILRGRVGRIALATSVPDCEVTIDEQAVGTTPIRSLPSSAWRRRLASCSRLSASLVMRCAQTRTRSPSAVSPTNRCPRLTTRSPS